MANAKAESPSTKAGGLLAVIEIGAAHEPEYRVLEKEAVPSNATCAVATAKPHAHRLNAGRELESPLARQATVSFHGFGQSTAADTSKKLGLRDDHNTAHQQMPAARGEQSWVHTEDG